jgi:DNA-directed RNA polymerase subunit RPC12/RpoP
MALIRCTECDKEISDKAKACVNCGCPVGAADSSPIDYKAILDMHKGEVIEAMLYIEAKYGGDAYAHVAELNKFESAVSNAPEPVRGDDDVRCPKCGSTSLTANKKGFGVGKALVGAALTGGVGLLAGGIGKNKVEVTCLKCGKKFKAGKGG